MGSTARKLITAPPIPMAKTASPVENAVIFSGDVFINIIPKPMEATPKLIRVEISLSIITATLPNLSRFWGIPEIQPLFHQIFVVTTLGFVELFYCSDLPIHQVSTTD
jgi:hypothetical protein